MALQDTNLSLVDNPEDWIKTANLLLKWNCALIRMLQFLSEITGKLNANLGHQHNNLEQVAGKSINSKTREKKKRVSPKKLHKLWWATTVAGPLGVHKQYTAHTLWLAWGQRDAWPWYTGTEALRAQTPSSRQWCPLSLSFLKADYRSRGPGKMAISSLSVW